MRRRCVTLVSVALLAAAIAPAAVSAQDDAKPQIGFLPGITDPFYVRMEQGVQAAERAERLAPMQPKRHERRAGQHR